MGDGGDEDESDAGSSEDSDDDDEAVDLLLELGLLPDGTRAGIGEGDISEDARLDRDAILEAFAYSQYDE